MDIKKSDFETLYRELQPRLYAYCRKFIRDPETSRDLVQDAFLKFWEEVDIAVIHTSIAAYLTKIVHNLCLLHLRNKQIHERYENHALLKLQEAELNFFSPDQNVYTPIFLKDMEDIIHKCIAKLPPRSRQIFEMSRMDGKTYPEIANDLKISIRTVENQIYRALALLKVELKDYMMLLLFVLLTRIK